MILEIIWNLSILNRYINKNDVRWIFPVIWHPYHKIWKFGRPSVTWADSILRQIFGLCIEFTCYLTPISWNLKIRPIGQPPAIGNIGRFHFESNIWIMHRIYLLFDAHIMEFENSADRPTGRPPAHGPTTWRGQPDRLLTWIYEFGVCFDQLFDVLYTCNKKVWNSSQAATCLWADYMAHLHGRVSRIIFDTFTMPVIPFFSHITNLERIKTEIISP